MKYWLYSPKISKDLGMRNVMLKKLCIVAACLDGLGYALRNA